MNFKQCYEVRNLNDKRVCDISDDRHMIIIGKGDCLTFITANADGTLRVRHKREIVHRAS